MFLIEDYLKEIENLLPRLLRQPIIPRKGIKTERLKSIMLLPLHQDQPHFKTAIYQAYYSYTDVIQRLQQRDTDLDLPENMPFLSWTLEVRERLFMTPAVQELFPEHFETQVVNEILELQNKLPSLIESYQISPDFSSDQLFELANVNANKSRYDFSLRQWQVVLKRPLFYYKKPIPLLHAELVSENVSAKCKQVFLERTSNNWWEGEELLDLNKDYFIRSEANGPAVWIYKNSRGEWFKHGIYS